MPRSSEARRSPMDLDEPNEKLRRIPPGFRHRYRVRKAFDVGDDD